MNYQNDPKANSSAQLQRLGNLAYMVMGMATEGGRTPYAITVVANYLSGATKVNGNWWQGELGGSP